MRESTLVIVMLIARTQPAWIIAIHRAIEMTIGIAVGLVVTALWPEPQEAWAPRNGPALRNSALT